MSPGQGNRSGISGYVNDSLDAEESALAGSAPQQTAATSSPLNAPRFPMPAEHGLSLPVPLLAASSFDYGKPSPNSSRGEASVIQLHTPARPGPLHRLPTDLSYADGASSSSAAVDVEKGIAAPLAHSTAATTTTTAAAAAAEAVAPDARTPAEDDEQWYQDQIDYVRNQVEMMENVEVQRDEEARSIRSKWKRELFLLFEDPSSSPSAFVINLFVTFMIILSAVLTTIETIPALRKGNSQMWFAFETGIVAVFTLEFFLRLLGHTDTWRQAWSYLISFVTIIDALAIFPYYIELIFSQDASYEFRFTILRIFRLLRVFSAFKYSSLLQLSIEVMIVAIKRSSDALLAFLLFVTLTVLLFSTLMYFAERGTWNEERQAFLTSDGEYSKFSSIPAAAYYSIVTLTTTGFGDMVPTTFIGKLVSFPMMISGILLIALPSIIVGRNFTQVWEAARKYRVQKPSARLQRVGDTLMEEGGDGANSSGRASRRSRRNRVRYRNNAKREGSVSSVETESSRAGGSHKETAGGYTNIYTGPRARGSNGDYTQRSDPIDDLARKDSFEMQEFAAMSPGQDERSDGYAQVDAIYSDDDDDDGDGDDNAAAGLSDKDASINEKSSYFSRQSEVSSSRKYRDSKGKERERDSAATIRVPKAEWDALNAELATLRSLVGCNGQVLRAIADHLSVPNLPPMPPPPAGAALITADKEPRFTQNR